MTNETTKNPSHRAEGFVLRPQTLKKRSDFLAARNGAKRHTPGFVLQARFRDDGTEDVRVGFTCSKRVGNAVARNRAKRRLREAAWAALPNDSQPGWDYVLIGRAEKTAAAPFAALVADLQDALRTLHKPVAGT